MTGKKHINEYLQLMFEFVTKFLLHIKIFNHHTPNKSNIALQDLLQNYSYNDEWFCNN